MVDQFGHYKILDRVGGDAVEVYRARDTRVGRTVALKVLPAELAPAERERLLRRARVVTGLSHPNIATLYEAGDEGGLFLVFEFVPGQTLTTLIAGGPLNPRRAVDLTIQMADAVAEAHAAGVAHGHITTDAIIITPKGHAKILDFGLADWTVRLGQAGPSDTPEDRGDIAALGALLFQMLTGRAPASGPLTPSAVNRSVPREIDPIVMKASAKNADRRYDSAATLAAELRSVAGVLEQRALSAPPPPERTARRTQAPAIWIAVVLVLGSLAAAAWWWL